VNTFGNWLRFDRIMAMSLLPLFYGPVYIWVHTRTHQNCNSYRYRDNAQGMNEFLQRFVWYLCECAGLVREDVLNLSELFVQRRRNWPGGRVRLGIIHLAVPVDPQAVSYPNHLHTVQIYSTTHISKSMIFVMLNLEKGIHIKFSQDLHTHTPI